MLVPWKKSFVASWLPVAVAMGMLSPSNTCLEMSVSCERSSTLRGRELGLKDLCYQSFFFFLTEHQEILNLSLHLKHLSSTGVCLFCFWFVCMFLLLSENKWKNLTVSSWIQKFSAVSWHQEVDLLVGFVSLCHLF